MNVDLKSLKAMNSGDVAVVMKQGGDLLLLEMTDRFGQRGGGGFVKMTFRNLVTDAVRHVEVRNELPADWKFVRRVSKGVNSRTINRGTTVAAEAMPGVDSGDITI